MNNSNINDTNNRNNNSTDAILTRNSRLFVMKVKVYNLIIMSLILRAQNNVFVIILFNYDDDHRSPMCVVRLICDATAYKSLNLSRISLLRALFTLIYHRFKLLYAVTS